jgi:hypothetical protein
MLTLKDVLLFDSNFLALRRIILRRRAWLYDGCSTNRLQSDALPEIVNSNWIGILSGPIEIKTAIKDPSRNLGLHE